jgi:hypothetical protein
LRVDGTILGLDDAIASSFLFEIFEILEGGVGDVAQSFLSQESLMTAKATQGQ